MEIGSQVCTPKEPKCLICPVASVCPTRAAGRQHEIPRPKKKKVYEDRKETVIVVQKRNRVLLRRCGADERWTGLWDFPRFESGSGANHDARQVKKLTGLDVKLENTLTTMKHGVTKYRITLKCRSASYISGRLLRGADQAWVRKAELHEYPLSVTGRKIADLLIKQ